MDQTAQVNLDGERLQIQRYQLYLQIASVLLSAFLVYTVVSGRKRFEEVEDSENHDEFNNYFED